MRSIFLVLLFRHVLRSLWKRECAFEEMCGWLSVLVAFFLIVHFPATAIARSTVKARNRKTRGVMAGKALRSEKQTSRPPTTLERFQFSFPRLEFYLAMLCQQVIAQRCAR